MSSEIVIAGGFYREICQFPKSDEYWGSGGRAAAAIAYMASHVKLVTVTDERAGDLLASVAEAVGFEYETALIPRTLSFEYVHPLSTPIIVPPPHTVQRPALEVRASCVLQFGMLDADITVEADSAVYDPQEPFSPRPFSSKRRPSRLAYVLNASEARALSGKSSVEEAIKEIATRHRPDVIVVKSSARGAAVYDGEIVEWVPSYATEDVWPIGSGDVFAAVFSAEWMLKGTPTKLAADVASRAVAEYVTTRTLPLRVEPSNHLNPIIQGTNRTGTYDVYLAGPFFNMPQRWLIEEARKSLKSMGLRVFSPLHDVGLGKADDVAPQDLAALRESRVLLAMVDGIDCGTIFEVGYARALSVPVIAFAEMTPEESLKMIAGSGCSVVDDFTTAIYRTVWAATR
jgi:nucleoside 2-deoxyribosyltransferase